MIYLVRHCKASNPHNLANYDTSLSPEGRDQLPALAAYFSDKNIKRVFYSPAKRVAETAEAIAAKGEQILLPEERLAERNWGAWGTLAWNELREKLQKLKSIEERYEFWPPGKSESWQEGEERLVEWWGEVAFAPSENSVIVTHEGTLRMLLPYLLREQLGGLRESLEWSLAQNFAQGSVSTYCATTQEFNKETYIAP